MNRPTDSQLREIVAVSRRRFPGVSKDEHFKARGLGLLADELLELRAKIEGIREAASLLHDVSRIVAERDELRAKLDAVREVARLADGKDRCKRCRGDLIARVKRVIK